MFNAASELRVVASEQLQKEVLQELQIQEDKAIAQIITNAEKTQNQQQVEEDDQKKA